MSQPTTLRQEPFSAGRAARIAGAAYLVTYATSVFAEFYARPSLVAADPARTAANVAAHAQLFRLVIASDLLTGVGVVVLNMELLAPAGWRLARFAAFWRLVERSRSGAPSRCAASSPSRSRAAPNTSARSSPPSFRR